MHIFQFATKTVARKIGFGFAGVIAVMIAIVAVTLFQMASVQSIKDRIIEVQTPTAETSLRLLSSTNQSLAGLRGYMLLRNNKFKEERNAAW
jgi:CHASE3 domain sensor protein